MKYYNVAIIGSPLEPLTYHFDDEIEPLTKVRVELRNRDVYGVVIFACKEPNFDTLAIKELTNTHYSKQQYNLAKFISNYYICSLGEAFGVMVTFDEQIPKYEKLSIENCIQLSQKQQEAFEFLKKQKTSLLFGDTGSGKTEIYMRFFQEVLKEGKNAIFLLPEISLTPQMQKRLKNHFDNSVILWHSKLTKKQKEQNLQKIYSGEARIVAGARSALFLPISDLGVIVVDEEHDDSYKSSSNPRYNAKDLAIYMGQLHNIPVILGSATPSLNSYTKFPHFRLKGGYKKTNKEFSYINSYEQITQEMIDALKANKQNNKQSIVFLPTRANFKYLTCKECGESIKCDFCSISMSIHHKINALKCHYCNYTKPISKICPNCGSNDLSSQRLGTVEAVKTLKENLKNCIIEQFDKDSITTATKLKKILKAFDNKEIDILVGTQMLSKGHDYSDVSLALILGLDNVLNMADYKARQKALSLLIQVSGRSGRSEDAKVIIQSQNQEFFQRYINDYDSFLEEEKYFRASLYPPFKKLCRVLFAHKNGLHAKKMMDEMLEKLKQFQNIEIVGSGQCAIERVANKYRFEILLRSDKSTELIKAIRYSKNQLAQIDMDPLDFA